MPTRLLKIVLLGATAVGKTSILRKWADKTIDIKSEGYAPTLANVSGDSVRKREKIGSHRVVINAYDTSGQERVACISQQFYSGANIALFVASFDLSRSVDSVSFWHSLLAEKCYDIDGDDEIDCYIILNKKDLEGSMEGALAVTKEEAEAKVKELGFKGIYYTSAYTGEGIEEAFTDSAKKYCESHPDGESIGDDVDLSTGKKDDKGCII
ncbi:Small GTPase like protein [Aduncisulcus paluster]|uniref:Small GTPase like protein n=1 Tax=Aduncisulcus paluster TaxID=2918883 RepID=A0ABQ5K1L0_9EUKA|nr:Small GTPase like protein [Aduncisulcus paluster]